MQSAQPLEEEAVDHVLFYETSVHFSGRISGLVERNRFGRIFLENFLDIFIGIGAFRIRGFGSKGVSVAEEVYLSVYCF
jgi:hypothetical protein